MDVDLNNGDVISPTDALIQPDPMDKSRHDQSTLCDLNLPSFLNKIPVEEESIYDISTDESLKGNHVTTYHIEGLTSI